MRRIATSLLLLIALALSGGAVAQTPVAPCTTLDSVPVVGTTRVNCVPVTALAPLPIRSPGGVSYAVGATGYAGYATPTDIFSIQGSATKTIKIYNIRISGYATADNNFNVGLFKRSTANTGGTPTTLTVVPMDSTSAAATGVATTYGTAPTVGTLVGALCACQLQVPAQNGTGGTVLEWQFNRNGGSPLILRGVNEMVTLNLYGVTLPAGINLNITAEWTEQ